MQKVRLLTWFVVALCVSLLGFGTARADKERAPEGTSKQALSARHLPSPSAIKVAILPFWDYSSDVNHTRVGSAVNWLLFQHEGFAMIPLLQSFAAFASDKDAEPGLALRKSDAQRIGKSVGADWVVYGEVREVRVYKKESVWRNSRKVAASMRIAVLDCRSGELFYWKTHSNTVGGPPIKNRYDKLLRLGALRVSQTALVDLFSSLPSHQTLGNVPETDDVATLVNSIWKEES